ncbi:hypothetical protein Syun_016965 [Stephania yunnanensis]|uniref:non-specific serine/threonine protein kinase n=1 Tax=Stephania yunnanensis TaxID=152371 RepID=A0AAP0P2M4_9MAGN
MPEIDQAPPGDRALFGKYDLGKLLGCGAFAKVYHARNLHTSQSVAIKSISKHKLSKSPNLASHIKREIEIMRRLSHPNIVKLHEVLASKSKIFFAMEFLKGGELFSRLAKGRFSEDLSRRYFHQLISAVEYCHSRGVFHRDLKPENLLLDENGDLKVSDFGLSAIKENDGAGLLLHTLCGTPAYVAPEILAKQGYDGAKADVWSCGVILFVMCAGFLPFNDPNLMVMYRKIYKGEFRCPRWFSPDLKCFLSRLLDTNPKTRITIDEIVRDPWFMKGKQSYYVKHGQINNSEWDDYLLKSSGAANSLNAFDLISFSTGFDLSGLFSDCGKCVAVATERFVCSESTDKVVEMVEEGAKRLELWVKRKESVVVLVGKNGECVAKVEVYRLTEGLVVVEVRFFEEAWKDKVRGLID